MTTTIENRIKQLEMRLKRAKASLPALVLAFVDRPSEDQQKQLDEARRNERPFLCLIQAGDTVYTNHHKGPPPWEI